MALLISVIKTEEAQFPVPLLPVIIFNDQNESIHLLLSGASGDLTFLTGLV